MGLRRAICCLLLVTTAASTIQAQSQPLQLVDSSPRSTGSQPTEQVAAPDSIATKRFIKQPSILWLPESLPGAFPAPGTAAIPATVPVTGPFQPTDSHPTIQPFRFASDAKTGDGAVGQTASTPTQTQAPKPKLPNDQLIPLADMAVPGNAGITPKAPTSDPNNSGAAISSGQTASAAPSQTPDSNGTSKSTLPSFFFPPNQPVQLDCYGQPAPYSPDAFCSPPIGNFAADPTTEALIYRGKTPIQTQRPWVEWGRPLYTAGLYPPANSYFFGETNLLQPHFYVYGDYRTGVGVNENQNGSARSWANRLNLDMDLQLTATERFHAFMGPLDRANDVSRLDFSDSQNIEYVNRTDLRLDTLFFEGDAGAILGGREGTYSPFDLPFAVGLMPLVYQNGIWMEDAALGAAFTIPSRHSTLLDWPNYEMSFFALTDQVTTDAFAGDNNAAEIFGTAWFIEAYDGYIEADYAFVHDDVGGHRSYHNASIGFTRRYLSRLSNSVRFLTNFDQALPSAERTADGYLFLIENSLITSNANFFVPYANFFYGSGRPQSVARAAGSGGILRNTGINFETDALTGYPTLDATANNTYGAAFGLNMLGNNFSQQLVLELAALAGTGSQEFRVAPGDQYAAGIRYQKPLSYRWIFRADTMYGWLRNEEDIYGNRIEFRWKF